MKTKTNVRIWIQEPGQPRRLVGSYRNATTAAFKGRTVAWIAQNVSSQPVTTTRFNYTDGNGNDGSVDRAATGTPHAAVVATSGYLTCDTAGSADYADYAALLDTAGFTAVLDGDTYADLNPDYTGVTGMAEVAAANTVVLDAALTGTICTWVTDHFIVTSPTTGTGSTVGYLVAPATLVDLSGSSWMNGNTGGSAVMTAGTDAVGVSADWASSYQNGGVAIMTSIELGAGVGSEFVGYCLLDHLTVSVSPNATITTDWSIAWAAGSETGASAALCLGLRDCFLAVYETGLKCQLISFLYIGSSGATPGITTWTIAGGTVSDDYVTFTVSATNEGTAGLLIGVQALITNPSGPTPVTVPGDSVSGWTRAWTAGEALTVTLEIDVTDTYTP